MLLIIAGSAATAASIIFAMKMGLIASIGRPIHQVGPIVLHARRIAASLNSRSAAVFVAALIWVPRYRAFFTTCPKTLSFPL